VAQGVEELLALHAGKFEIRELQVLGATTVVTNAVLERKGVETAFISTAGFQDMLRIRNEGRYDLYDLQLKYPEPLVPRRSSYGVRERISADGTVVTILNEDDVREIAAKIMAKGIKSVAV
jgi:N-methylhydantoinase A